MARCGAEEHGHQEGFGAPSRMPVCPHPFVARCHRAFYTRAPVRALLQITREERERHEERLLAPAATRAAGSRGREVAEEPDPYRTCFERDRDRILHSKAFRRLKHKPEGRVADLVRLPRILEVG